MSFVITLVCSRGALSDNHIDRMKNVGYEGNVKWLADSKAADIIVPDKPTREQIQKIRAVFLDDGIDVFVMASANRRKRLLIADMDSTIVEGETLDELAAEAGIKDRIAPITARAMRGDLDFEQALRERVSLLHGLPENKVQETLARTKLNPGADVFVQTMKKSGATCVLVSGGFTMFTGAFAQQAGFDYHHGNLLQVRDGVLTGAVEDPVLDKEGKVSFLKHYMNELGLQPGDVMAIGDGANDLPMLQIAGLGIGYKPKPLLEEALDNCIIHGDLSAALYAQGFRAEEIF